MRIAFYYTHREAYGHGMRVMKLADSLNKIDNSDILILQGGKPQRFLRKEGIKMINLPSPVFDRGYFHFKGPPDMEKIRKRITFMKKTLMKFKPDVFITEFFPFGREEAKYEIYPLIKYLKKRIHKIKVLASVGYPVPELNCDDVLKFSGLYDKIFIHTPEDIDPVYVRKFFYMKKWDPKKYDELLENLREKIVFTGYVTEKTKPRKNIRKTLGIDSQKFILVSRGSGVYEPKIIPKSLKASQYIENSFFLVCAGISSGKEKMKVFRRLAGKFGNVRLVEFLQDFRDYLASCDVSVNMSGYNTYTDLLWFKKKSVTIPLPRIFADKRIDPEQMYRGIILKEFLGSSILNLNKLDEKTIASKIRFQLERKGAARHEIMEEWFNGSENFANEIAKYG